MKSIYIIIEGETYTSNKNNIFCTTTKKLAEQCCRSDGFKFSKKDDCFINKDDTLYRVIEQCDLIT